MRPLVQPWTVEDDERLKTLAAQGASIIKASAALKRKIINRRGGPDADRRAKLLICQTTEGSNLDAYLHLDQCCVVPPFAKRVAACRRNRVVTG
jgi:hypothetical protein